MFELSHDMLTEIASKVDEDLRATTSTETDWTSRGAQGRSRILTRQKNKIKKLTGESADSFLDRFRQAAWNDLCVEGGYLNKIRERWLNPTKPSVIKSVGALLTGMGISGNLVPILLVPLLIILLHLGAEAFCAVPVVRERE